MKKKLFTSIMTVAVVIGIIFFWKCPFESFTGIPCPGCMMTTAAYYLIQLDFKAAFYFNPAIYLLLVMSIVLFFAYQKNRKVFQVLLIGTFIAWGVIYVIRMMTIFPNYPMPYVEENVIMTVLRYLGVVK